MDNRLRFLYCHMTELWGRRKESAGRDWKDRCKRSTSASGKSGVQWETVIRTELE